MEYTVLTEATEAAIIRLVTEHIDAGWVPQGGISIGTRRTSLGFSEVRVYESFYAQAMICGPKTNW